MTDPYPERLFYFDSYLTEFEAEVVERLAWEGHPAVVLDRTALYPTSGGQPSDRGALSAVPVLGVEVREADGAVIHLLADDLPTDHVLGEVDWSRRFDHMQQHTGQHLLSAACEQLLDADTVGFHLGSEMSTIDLSVERLPPEALEPVEGKANRVIWENRQITARFVGPAELAPLHLRHPPKVEGPVRLVEVAGFDVNPCGGTHVARSGEIGLLKVTRVEYRGHETRVEFLCGERALRDYCLKHQTLQELAAGLSVGYWELPEAVARLQESLKTSRRQLRTAQDQALEATAARLAGSAVAAGPLLIVRALLEGHAPDQLRVLALKTAAQPGGVALLASLADRVHLCFARAEGVSLDAAVLLRIACAELGGRGGGQPHVAQGSAPPTDRERVEEVLSRLAAELAAEHSF
jgi:alanyl-tRNA synthetase